MKNISIVEIGFIVVAAAIILLGYVYRNIDVVVYLAPILLLACIFTIVYKNQINWPVLKDTPVLKIGIVSELVVIVITAAICYYYQSLPLMAIIMPLSLAAVVSLIDGISEASKNSGKIQLDKFKKLSAVMILAYPALLVGLCVANINEYQVPAMMVMLTAILLLAIDEFFKSETSNIEAT